jgi:outer membrane lipoprotein-sorting protein
MKKNLLALCLSLIVLSFSSLQAQSADEIVQKHVEAKGGIEAWKKVNALYMKMSTSMMGMEIPTEVWVQTPDKMKNVVSFQGKNIITVIDGQEGWMVNPMMGSTKAEKLPESALKDMKDQADMAGPLFDYKTKGHSVELLGEDDLDGTEVYKLKLTEKEGDVSTFFIDKDSYMILKMTAKKKVNGQEEESSIEFSDYRKVEGLSFAFSTTMGAAGQTLASKISELKVNPAIDAKMFAKPE